MKSVYLTVPNGSGWMHKSVHFAVCRILSDGRFKVRHDCPTHTPYVQNLHKCMHDFINRGEDFWLSMDADNPPRNNPLDLVELDLDVVGLPTPVWHCDTAKSSDAPFYWNALDRLENGWIPHQPCVGLQEVDAIGSGCFLVSRRVMLALKDQQPFMRRWGKDGLVQVGGDYSFCEKVKAAGFKVWAHYGYPCRHFVEIELTEAIEAFRSMKWN